MFKWWTFKWYVLVFGIMAIISYSHNLLLEGVVLFVSFHFIRYSFPKTYHHPTSFYSCIIISLSAAWFVLPKVLPFQYSLFYSILLGWFVGYYAYRMQDMIDKFNAHIKELETYALTVNETLRKVNPKTLEPDELYWHCRKQGLSDDLCKIAKIIIYDGLKGKALYKAIGYSERQTKRLREKIFEVLDIN